MGPRRCVSSAQELYRYTHRQGTARVNTRRWQGFRGHLYAPQGFSNVVVCDWAEKALQYLLEKEPSFPKGNLVCADFFQLEGNFDLLLEQTFFCAIDPARRGNYVRKAAELLRPEGTLAGLLFANEFPFEGPPFGGTKAEYEALFSPYFDIVHLDIAQDSAAPRAGNELFFHAICKA